MVGIVCLKRKKVVVNFVFWRNFAKGQRSMKLRVASFPVLVLAKNIWQLLMIWFAFVFLLYVDRIFPSKRNLLVYYTNVWILHNVKYYLALKVPYTILVQVFIQHSSGLDCLDLIINMLRSSIPNSVHVRMKEMKFCTWFQLAQNVLLTNQALLFVKRKRNGKEHKGVLAVVSKTFVKPWNGVSMYPWNLKGVEDEVLYIVSINKTVSKNDGVYHDQKWLIVESYTVYKFSAN